MPKILDNPREKILLEATLLLGERGYKKFSMREVATRCEIGIGTVYNYFINKYDLVNEIFLVSWNKIVNSLNYLKYSENTFEEKMKAVYEGIEKFLTTYMETFIEINKVEEKNRHCKSEKIMEPLYKVVDKIVENYKNNGEISFPLETRKMTIFIITNMISIIKGNQLSLDDLILVITK